MSKRYLTLDDLYAFCKQKNLNHFSAKEADGPIIVHTPGQFEVADVSQAADVSQNGLLPVKLQACHTGTNRNKSHISSESMTAALPSFSNPPILGYIHQLEDGTWDLKSNHKVKVVIEDIEDESAEDQEVESEENEEPSDSDEENDIDMIDDDSYLDDDTDDDLADLTIVDDEELEE